MRDINSGYVGCSRSKRSQKALENYEIPLSLLTRDKVVEFLRQSDYTSEETQILINTPLTRWKFAATSFVSPSSWHHTGTHFRRTNHYSIESIAEFILANSEKLKRAYEIQKKTDKVQSCKSVPTVVLYFNIWGGTRKHPKIVATEKRVGYEKNGILYYVGQRVTTPRCLDVRRVTIM